MDRANTTVERAYQLADSGEFELISDISRKLSQEGWPDPRGHLVGNTLITSLRRRIAAARAAKMADAK
jgi:hypothetical protein